MALQSSIHECWNDLSQSRNDWNKIVNALLNPISNKIIESLSITPRTATLLDVATGTGEPGLTIAEKFPATIVTGVDLSDKMLEYANENARQRDISNYITYCCNAMELPFADHSFDAVLCRNGVMFFNSIETGLREMHRVLKPEGRTTVSTWGLLEKNLWISMVLDAMKEVTGRRMYNNHIPGMFYCMQPGFMTDWFEEIGMHHIQEEEMTGIIEFNSAEEHWNYVTSVSAAVVNALIGLQPQEREQVKELLRKKITTHIVHDKLYFQWTARITSGVK
jgi:ubiquinone/menaquinone biosynthesis C-methylase UbiE